MFELATTRAVRLIDPVQGIIKGYHFIWGSPDGSNGVGLDSYGTWFDRARPPNYSAAGSLVGYPICVEHGEDPVIGADAVAVIVRTYFDDIGLAFEAQLDQSQPAYERTLTKIVNGDYKTSSSSAEHMAQFYEDGAFRNWMHTETSLVENPAQAEMPAVSLLRRAEGERDVRRATVSTPLAMEIRTMNPMPDAGAVGGDTTPAPDMTTELTDLVAMYGLDAVQAALDAISGAAAPAAPPDTPPTNSAPQLPRAADFMKTLRAALETHKQTEDAKQVRADIDALKAAQQALHNAPPEPEGRAVRGTPSISVSEPRKYWGRSTNDLLFAHQLIHSREFRAHGVSQSEEFLNVMAGRVAHDQEKNPAQFSDPAVRSVMPKSMRANEIATSTASGGGDEWVGIKWSTDLWGKARNVRIYEELVARGMVVEEVGQGFESVYIATEGADPTVYTIAQPTDLDATGRPTVNVAATRIGTGRVLLTPGEIGMAVAYTDVFDEDSLIRVAPQYNRQMEEKAAETVEQLFLNGDSATSVNVNYDGGTPGTGLSTPYYIASNGARKYALVTGSSTSRSAGTLDENDFRLTLKLMSSAIRTRKAQMVFIIDPDTHNTALDIAAIKTEDVRRTNATIVSGMLENIYGVDVLESGFIPSADTDGKVTYNGNVAETGSILLVYAPYWAVATKRKITVETDRDILSGTNIIVAKMRIGFAPRGAGAAVESYNVTIA